MPCLTSYPPPVTQSHHPVISSTHYRPLDRDGGGVGGEEGREGGEEGGGGEGGEEGGGEVERVMYAK